MRRVRRSLLFIFTAAPLLMAALAPTLEAQTAPLALVCTTAGQAPVHLRIDYDKESVDGYPAKFTHDQISWQVKIRNGATEDFKYDRNRGVLAGEVKPLVATGHAPAAERPTLIAAPASSYHCRRAD